MAEPLARVPRSRVPAARLVGTQGQTGRLLIRISTGSGMAPTRIAAFDSALHAAGVADYNLVRLSSVIPPYAVVREVAGPEQIRGALGDVAYCVYAAAYADTPGEQTWAGLAWAMDPDDSGGLLVEHTARSEPVVRRELLASIEAMSHARGDRYRVAGQAVSSAVCVEQPVCAVVVASYGTAGWSGLLNSEG